MESTYVIACGIDLAHITIIVGSTDPLIISIIGCVHRRVDDACIAQVASEISDSIDLIAVRLSHAWITHHHGIVVIKLAEQIASSRIDRASRCILTSCHSRWGTVHCIGVVGHLQQFAVGAKVLLGLQLA
jgi:hypothetical protein